MGIRNLTIVQLDGEYKIAQYGQWDGYPECGGIEALNFARKLQSDVFRKRFETNLRKCRFLTEEEANDIDKRINSGVLKDWEAEYPQLSRNMCRDILDYVYEHNDGVLLANSIDFAADSLFCEWAWLIDLDKNTFEAFVGFNDATPLTDKDRFGSLKNADYTITGHQYYPIIKAAEWSLSDLPNDDEFLETFKEDDGEEEED